MRPIRLLGDPVLRTPAEPVTDFDAALHGLVTDLMDTLLGATGRAGVAAPQIGVGVRVFVYNAGGETGHVVNPVLEVSDERQDGEEGCLSLPGLWYPLRRAWRVVATGFDLHGEPKRVVGDGMLARCLQHETDHLDGVLFIDRLDREVKKEALKAMREGFPVKKSPHAEPGL